jgi:putative nucleotidyltransferase with HDIG domain
MRLQLNREGETFGGERSDGGVGGEPVCPKFHAVQRWVARRLGTVRHERQVAAIASNLFDLTRPLHKLSLADRRLLRLAALVHDVGRCVSKEEHPKEGARMLVADATLPLTPAERRALAYLTLYHRGSVPDVGRDAVLHRTDEHERLLYVLALLRTADALDSRSLEDSARLVFALVAPRVRTEPRQLRATCYLTSDSAKARKVYRRRKKFRLMEELLDVRVEVEIDHAEGLRLVA